MREQANYMRHVGDRRSKTKGTGATVFFRGTPPVPESEWSEWAFWQIPPGHHDYLFRGKLVAEDGDRRCIRLHHATKSCERCRSTAEVKA